MKFLGRLKFFYNVFLYGKLRFCERGIPEGNPEIGKKVKEVGPSTPTLVLGLSGAPQAGEKFKILESDSEARQIAARRGQISREQANRASKRISLDEIGRRLALGTFKELNLIIKSEWFSQRKMKKLKR